MKSTYVTALEAAVEAVEQTLDGAQTFERDAMTAARDHLRACLEVVLERHEDALRTNAELRDLVIRSRAVHARAQPRPRPVTEARRAPLPPEQARVLIDRYGLRRCRECESDLLLVRDDITVGTHDGVWPLVAVACGHCGDVRLRMRDAETLDRARDDRAWQLLALPGGTPFRSG